MRLLNRTLPLADVATAVALALVGLLQLLSLDGLAYHWPLAVLGVLAATLPQAFRHTDPLPSALVPLGGVVLLVASGIGTDGLLLGVLGSGVLSLYTLLRLLERRLAWLAGGLLAAAFLGACVMMLAGYVFLGRSPGQEVILLSAAAGGTVAIVTLAADLRRTRNEVRQVRADNTEALRHQAAMAERARIAREMHDVVAHSISMIAVQAEAAPYTLKDLGEDARAEFAEIAANARTTLAEMRRLLGVLRADVKDAPETAPQPGVERLPELIEQHDGPVDLDVVGEPRPLPQAVDVSAYRIVQECLANAAKHAPGSRVSIELAYRPAMLVLRVADDGPEASIGEGGHGLIGMRERALSLGGWFSAEPITGGGFLVKAGLPTE
ncbi:sensor histidine kinase [Thermoactinospora rubra]|uniref:sensor histidine kinase n=1 Tax=Thermoactinospora rubra TaxID=1088767 RepID=UPI000A10A4DE|nr:sensor histidine kinase [Thermoactinospora rubra]